MFSDGVIREAGRRILRAAPPGSRVILFGSHAPFFVTQASVAKLATAQLPAKTRAAIAAENARRFFDLSLIHI